MNNSATKDKSFKGILLIALIKMFAYLPVSISQSITGSLAWLVYHFKTKNRKTTEVNLKLCYPHLKQNEIDKLTRDSIKSTSHLITEIPRVWIRPYNKTAELIHHVEGEELLTKDTTVPTVGTLIITPHIGNWEVLFQYMLQKYTVSALYRPPKIAELEPVMRTGRQQSGGNIIRTTRMEARKMLKVLKNGEFLILLPDQNPKDGSGVFAPFYGIPAYTMTLLQGLVKRTKANIIMATAIRSNGGYSIHFNDVNIEPSLSDEDYATQLNLYLQKTIDKNPEQYEWAYKRFKKAPEGKPSYYD